MIDVKFTQNEYNQFDFDMENGDFSLEDGFDTSLYISLLTDGRANEKQVISAENRRGWIGDISNEVNNRTIGSLLWTVEQRRLTTKTLNETVDFCRNAVKWYIEDSICNSVEVTGSIVPLVGIYINIDMISKKGITYSHYIQVWRMTGK